MVRFATGIKTFGDERHEADASLPVRSFLIVVTASSPLYCVHVLFPVDVVHQKRCDWKPICTLVIHVTWSA